MKNILYALGVSKEDREYVQKFKELHNLPSKSKAGELMFAFLRENEFALNEYFKRKAGAT